MKKIVAKTLQDALLKASEELRCSVVDLEYEIVQNPSNGILGIGRKEAIIIVDDKASKPPHAQTTQATQHDDTNDKNPKAAEIPTQVVSSLHEVQEKSFDEAIWGETKAQDTKPHKHASSRDSQEATNLQEEADSKEVRDSQNPQATHALREATPSALDSLSHSELPPKRARTKQPYFKQAFDEIEREIVELFSYLPFEIDSIKVELYKENVVAVTLNGPDCALLIGEKGYRYKAISYLLFNWINPKYGYGVRLEIAEFLRNQEQMIDAYLDGIIKIVRTKGAAQTKVLDGVLAYIALGKLRVIFPQKYISFRNNDEGQRYIVIEDFKPV